jgi:hypothetical protein
MQSYPGKAPDAEMGCASLPVLADSVANSQNALRSISRKLTKRAAIADRRRLQAIAEVACEFIADY